jgi:hypothetical protein
MWSLILKFGGFVASLITGGSLDRILSTIEHRIDDETKKEEIKADVTKTWVNAQASLLVGRTWWFQLFFVIPMAVHWAALNFVSAFPMYGWTVHALPDPFDDFQAWIISALFIVDGSKAILGRFMK